MVRESEVLFTAAGTPPAEDGAADLSSVADVAWEIDRMLAVTERRRPLNMVDKSPMPVGAEDCVSMLIREGAAAVRDERAEFWMAS